MKKFYIVWKGKYFRGFKLIPVEGLVPLWDENVLKLVEEVQLSFVVVKMPADIEVYEMNGVLVPTPPAAELAET